MPIEENKFYEKIGLAKFSPTDERVFMAACVAVAFVIRYFLIPHDSVINGDGVYYTLLGERLVSGDIDGGISAYWSPLYSALTGIFSLVFSDREFAGRCVSLLAGSLLVVPGYRLIDVFFGRLSAYIGTVLLVFHPFLIKSSGWVMTESLYTLVFTICVLFGWYAVTCGCTRVFLVTGLLLGAAFLIKPEAIGYLVLMLAFTFAPKFFNSKAGYLRPARNYLVLLGGFLLIFAPYFFFLHHKTGQWTLSQKIAVNLPAADFEGDFLSLTADGRMTMKDRIWGDDYETEYKPDAAPADPARRSFSVERLYTDARILGAKSVTLLKKQFRDYFPAILPLPFLILAVAGFFRRPWTKMRAAKEVYLFSFVACTLIGYAASTVELRYLFPIIPILIAWAANGVVEFGRWSASTVRAVSGTSRKISPASIAFCVLLVLLGSMTPLFFNVFKPDDMSTVPFEERNAGLWIKEHAERSNPLVMSSNITAAFYAGARHLYLPDEDLSTVVRYAKSRQADYLVFSERRTKDASAFLEDRDGSLAELKLAYHDEQNPDYEIRVYQLTY